MEQPVLQIPLKGELLRRTLQRYPGIDIDAIAALSSIKQSDKLISCGFDDHLAELNLSEGKFYVLCYLFTEEVMEHDAPSPSAIADAVDVARATVTGLLDGLERDGFLERRHDTHDRRALTIRMTDKARSLMDDFVPTMSGWMGALAAGLTVEEKQTLVALLTKLESSIESCGSAQPELK